MGQLIQKLDKLISEIQLLNGQQGRTREILSVEQAAEYLGQSEHTLRDWVRLRKIPYCKINGSIKFRKSRLDRWIDQHEIAVME